MKIERPEREQKGRGCVFFDFGTRCALQLLVSIHSLRKYYDGPITVFLAPDEHSNALKQDIERFGATVSRMDNLSKSYDRHRIFIESPYATTLSFDSDIIFRGPVDALWEPLEQEGVLVTRFYAPPYGVDGKARSHGFASRIQLLSNAKALLEPATFERALKRMVDERIDINVGVLGVSRPKGDMLLGD
jgi:hypothetical protein